MKDKHYQILFKQRKNKTFNYQSRFPKDNEVDSYLETSKRKDFIAKWQRNNKSKGKSVMNMRTLILILVLLLICMYLLEKKYM